MRTLGLPIALALAGCGGGEAESPLNNQQLARVIENIAEAQPEREEEPPAVALVEIRREDLERELRPGAGCDFSESGRLLFVAVAGDALAKVNGRPVHFAASGPAGATGGFFTAGERFTISVGRLGEAGVTVDESTTWPARLVLTERGRDEGGEVRIDGAWRCGA